MTKKLKIILIFLAVCLIGAGVFLARLEISDFFSGYFSDTWKGDEVQLQTVQNLKLLSSHSRPEAGDEWVVSFETRGSANLAITPADPDSIGDLDFVSLSCDGKEKTEEEPLQILEGDVIFYPDWQCDGTGKVIHLVNIARKHTLKFQFSNKMAFAYNNPDSVTDTFDANNPGGDPEYYIASKENITVSGGQVYLATCGDNGGACDADGDCCSDYCVDDVCCNSECTGLCKTCSSFDGGTAGTCHNTNDNFEDDDECGSPSYNACSNQYTRIGPDGYCDGNGACDTNDYTAYVSAGDVCYQGSSVNPSGSQNCGTGAQYCYCDNDWYQCDAINDCTYDRYYVGFNNGASCTQTGKVLRTSNVNNPNYYRCKTSSTIAYQSYTSIMDQNKCAICKRCSNGSCTNVNTTCYAGDYGCASALTDFSCCPDQHCRYAKCVDGSCVTTGCSCGGSCPGSCPM